MIRLPNGLTQRRPMQIVLWAALPLLTAALVSPTAMLPGWTVPLPALVVALWCGWLTCRPEQTLPLVARRSAVVVITLLGARYLVWRIGATLNLATPISTGLGLLMLAAELTLLANGLLQLWLTWARQPPVQQEAAAAESTLQQRIAWEPWRVPTVDVLVPSCGEPVDLIERCLSGCLAMDYPRHQVWLLDDSARPELSRLCRRLGCRYLSRDGNTHAKAGNLNHALPHLNGELLAVFDADVVPRAAFLARSVGLFTDPRVGFVQTPQTYMNADPVMRNLRLERWLMPDEESFYRWIEPTRQAVGAVVCAGTSFVMRRSALERVGGFETGTPSEDLATGIRLAAAGYRNLYLDAKLSAGLAPFTIGAMARQRCRWASGTLQTLRTGANPFTIAGLTPLQRIAYLEGILHWFNVVPQLLLLLMPLSLGLLGVAPILVRGPGLVTMALPFYLSQLLLVSWFSRDARNALLPELYRWIFLLPLVGAVLSTLAGRPQHFRVTPKAISGWARPGPEQRLLVPLLGLLGLQLLNLTLLIVGPGTAGAIGAAASSLAPANQALGLTWSQQVRSTSLLLALRTCWDRTQDNPVPWLRIDGLTLPLHAPGGERPARILAISEQGVELALAEPGGNFPGDELPADAGSWGLALPGRPGDVLPLWPEQRRHERGLLLIGCRWGPLSDSQTDALQALLYRGSGEWPSRQAPFEPKALLAVLALLLQPVPAQGWFRRSLISAAGPKAREQNHGALAQLAESR
ncbi:glycosyltransferase [Synechococcus sp. BA-124 BA4]|uniref:glycosyltransferase family 2 protein n=1 Tax=unclassified Synechococcus TaxID=2626047 RepID=UPI002AD4E52F|nr:MULTISPECIES: glycosyltransferase [unclassified Synechococcus]MEA5401115.1 glycosyltransferase [Synechococcus sp. BA-124 BA4]